MYCLTFVKVSILQKELCEKEKKKLNENKKLYRNLYQQEFPSAFESLSIPARNKVSKVKKITIYRILIAFRLQACNTLYMGMLKNFTLRVIANQLTDDFYSLSLISKKYLCRKYYLRKRKNSGFLFFKKIYSFPV